MREILDIRICTDVDGVPFQVMDVKEDGALLPYSIRLDHVVDEAHALECPECNGRGFKSVYGHACNGDDRKCQALCPVEGQENCSFCGGTGQLGDAPNDGTEASPFVWGGEVFDPMPVTNNEEIPF